MFRFIPLVVGRSLIAAFSCLCIPICQCQLSCRCSKGAWNYMPMLKSRSDIPEILLKSLLISRPNDWAHNLYCEVFIHDSIHRSRNMTVCRNVTRMIAVYANRDSCGTLYGLISVIHTIINRKSFSSVPCSTARQSTISCWEAARIKKHVFKRKSKPITGRLRYKFEVSK